MTSILHVRLARGIGGFVAFAIAAVGCSSGSNPTTTGNTSGSTTTTQISSSTSASLPPTSAPGTIVVESDSIVIVHFVVDAFDGDQRLEATCVCFHLDVTADLVFGPTESNITVEAVAQVHYTRHRHDINPYDRTPIDCDVVSDEAMPITIHASRSNGRIRFQATTPGWFDDGTYVYHNAGTLPTFPSCYRGDFANGLMLPGGTDAFRLYTPYLIVEETKGSTAITPIDFTYVATPTGDSCRIDATVTPMVFCDPPYFDHLAPLEKIMFGVPNQPAYFTGTWTLTVIG